jgi:hypothetical protein
MFDHILKCYSVKFRAHAWIDKSRKTCGVRASGERLELELTRTTWCGAGRMSRRTRLSSQASGGELHCRIQRRPRRPVSVRQSVESWHVGHGGRWREWQTAGIGANHMMRRRRPGSRERCRVTCTSRGAELRINTYEHAAYHMSICRLIHTGYYYFYRVFVHIIL